MTFNFNPNIKKMIAKSPSTGEGENYYIIVNWENIKSLAEQGFDILYEDTLQPVDPKNFEKELNPFYKN